MSSDDEDEMPELVPADMKKVPITVITGCLGRRLLCTSLKVHNYSKRLREIFNVKEAMFTSAYETQLRFILSTKIFRSVILR